MKDQLHAENVGKFRQRSKGGVGLAALQLFEGPKPHAGKVRQGFLRDLQGFPALFNLPNEIVKGRHAARFGAKIANTEQISLKSAFKYTLAVVFL